MGLYSLKIKERLFNVKVISDKKEMKEGLSGKPKLGKDKGLLFNFKTPQTVTMNMRGMSYPLDIIFIDENMDVVAVRPMNPGNYETTVKNARLVLEVNKGMGNSLVGEKAILEEDLLKKVGMLEKKLDNSNINIIVSVSTAPESLKPVFKKGGKINVYEEHVKAEKDSMQVLDHTGRILMNLKGGERILSIEHTEKLIALSKKVEKGEASTEELGKLVAEILHIQDTQKPEYVD